MPRSHPVGVRLMIKVAGAVSSAVLGIVLSAQVAAATNLDTDGKTVTSIKHVQASHLYDVTTTTHSSDNKTAFNSFHDFTLDAADTVNMHLPGSSQNLVNLVWDSQTVINGTVNSVLGNGTSGAGNLFFADPHGVVVGATGVLNVGALSLSAPTSDFMQTLLGSDGKVNPNADAVNLLLTGQEEDARSAGTCLICVRGKINAANAVRIRATAIDVSGTIYVAGNDGGDSLSTAVNVEGQDTPVIVTDGNTIRLIAEDKNEVAIGDVSADASITIGAAATLTTDNKGARPADDDAAAASWGLVQASTHAVARAAFETPEDGGATATLVTRQATDLFKDQDSLAQKGFADAEEDANLAASANVGQVAYVRASGTASTQVAGTINALGDVDLSASTETEASTDATSEAGAHAAPVMVGAMYGAVYAKAGSNVASTASISAGGDVKVNANTDNDLDVSANTVAGDQVLATTVSWSQAAVSASSTVDGSVDAQSLRVLAHNSNSFATEASSRTSETDGSVGVAGAVSLQTVVANAQLNKTPTLPAIDNGEVTVAAGSDTSKNSTSATTGTGAESAKDSEDDTGATDTDLSGALSNKSNAGLNADGSEDSDALPFHLGAAVAYTDSSNTASATIGDGVHITTPGNVTVYSGVTDAGVHNGARSEAVSKAEDGKKSGSPEKVDIAAGVAFANYGHQSTASIGSNAEISAAHIGVGSDVSMPFDWSFGQADNIDAVKNMFGSLDDFIAGTQALKELSGFGADDITDGVTGYANAAAGGDSQVAVGGSVNYLSVTNTNRAWVGDNSQLTSTADAVTNAGDEAWESDIEWRDEPLKWAHSLSVVANTDVTIFDLVGDITPWKTDTQGSKAAIGGAFNYTGYSNDTVAGVGSGATLTSNNIVAVNAASTDTLVALSPVSGKGGTAGFEGTVAMTDVNDATHASVSAAANVTAQALNINADNAVMIWSLAGALAMSNSVSIGISVAINNLTTDTLASIGDNSGDDPLGAIVPPAAQTGGKTAVSSLALNANTSGESGALSVAGSSVGSGTGGGSAGESGGDKGGSGAEAGSGEKLLDLIEKVKSVTGDLQTAVATVDGISSAASGGSGDDDSLLGKAGEVLEQVSSATEAVSSAGDGLKKLTDKASAMGEKKGGTAAPGNKSKGGKFGIGISGAATANLANLRSRAELDGADIDNDGNKVTDVTLQGINKATLTSISGAAALQRSRGGGFGGAIAGAVAYSSIGNTTSAMIVDASRLIDADNVALRALDGSQQIGVALGVAANTSNGTSTTIAGSVSIAHSKNATHAGIEGGSTLDGGDANNATLDISAYDHSRIGVGGGSLYFNKSRASSGNAGIGFTYADIANVTTADLAGHQGSDPTSEDIHGYDTLSLRALDSSLIGAGAVAGGYSASQNGASLAGAIIWTHIGNTTGAFIADGMNVSLGGAALVQASAVKPDDTLDGLIDSSNATAATDGYDFSGAGIDSPDPLGGSTKTPGSDGDPDQPGADALSLQDTGLGSSIIAVAGTVQIGGNNVGLSYAGNNISNTHAVSIDNASINTGGALTLQASDDTRIIGLAVGAAVSTGQFAGLGSATSNIIHNTDRIAIGSAVTDGHSASIQAGSVDAHASDNTKIYSLAGNVAIGKGQAAAGGAVTYNDISNQVHALAGDTAFDVVGDVGLRADESAMIMAGGVAAAVSKAFALTLSFGWNQTGNDVLVSVDDGSTLSAGSVTLDADNDADIYALAGAVSISGKAAVGLAASVADIDDSTTASLDNVGVDVGNGAVDVGATGAGTQYSLSVAGAVSGQGAGVAGAGTINTITSDVTAGATTLYGVDSNGAPAINSAAAAKSLAVHADNNADIYSLAGGLGVGEAAGIGAAVTVADIGGTTSATLNDSVLDVADSTQVTAGSGATVDTASIAGAAADSAAISLSDSTNLIHNTISAGMTNVGTEDATGSLVSSNNATKVKATNNATINALSGAVAGAGSVAAGGAVAVNNIGTTTSATFSGDDAVDSPLYKVASIVVDAGASNPNASAGGNNANIKTIAVGAAGGGDAAVGGSVAVNLLSSKTTASIDRQAHIIASDNVGVLAGNDQGIDVFAGQVALSGTVGVGLGVAINKIDGSTTAGIDASDVSAYGDGTALDVDSGTVAHGDDLDGSINVTGSDDLANSIADPSNYGAPDLSGTITHVHGVAVNATNKQHIATLGLGASVSGEVAVNGLAGVNIIGGATNATITGSAINQADREVELDGIFYDYANADQQADVRANSRQDEANFVANIAGSGGVAVNGSAATNVFSATTHAKVSGSTVSSQGKTAVDANGQQWSLAVAAGAALSGGVGGAASATVTLFNAQTQAELNGGSVDAGALDVMATGSSAGAQIAGAVGIGVGTAGIAGAAAVNVDHAQTTAIITGGAQVNADGAVNVNADSRNVAEGIVISGAAGTYAGVAGGALVNVIANGTHASIEDASNVTAADIGVNSQDTQTAKVYSGVLGGGFVGIGGGLNLLLQQASVGAAVLGSTISALGNSTSADPGSINIGASSSRDVNSTAVAVAGGAGAVGLSAGVVVAGTGDISRGGDASNDLHSSGQMNLDNLDSLGGDDKLNADPTTYGLSSEQLSSDDAARINSSSSYALGGATGSQSSSFGASDGVQAIVNGGTVTAHGPVSINAKVLNSITNAAGGVAVGAFGMGGALAYTTLNTDIKASVDGGATVNSRQGTTIAATAADGTNGHAASSKAVAGVGGLVGIGAAVSISHVHNTVTASANGTLGSTDPGQGGLQVTASDSSSAHAGNDNLTDPSAVNIGGVVAGAVVVDALRASSVSASIAGSAHVSGFSTVDVSASDTGIVQANGVMGSGGIVTAISAVVATASDTSDVVASIGDNADISAGTTTVSASASPQAKSGARGITVGGIADGIGANVSTASVSTTSNASVGDNVVFHSGDLKVKASTAPTVDAISSGGAGAALLGVNASTAKATDKTTVLASVGNHVKLPSGNVSIAASGTTHQSASASGDSGGIISAGASLATASSDTTTIASLGDGDGSSQATAGSLSVTATGNDVNDANSTAGSGGLISGNASHANTSAKADTEASVGSDLALNDLSSFQLNATQTDAYGGVANSILAAVIGGSGAYVNNTISSATRTSIGDDTDITTAGDIDVLAQTTLGNDGGHNQGATGGAGGGISGAAAGVKTVIEAGNTATIGERVNLVAGTNANAKNLGHIAMLAGTIATALGDTATTTNGGLIPVAKVSVDEAVNTTSTVSVGANDNYTSYGRTDIGTYSALHQVAATATANAYGGSAIGVSDSSANVGSSQSVTIGKDVRITSYGEADIVAGKDIMHARETVLAPSAVAQSYVRGLIAIPHAAATATTTSHATLTLASGSKIVGGGDVAIGAMQGSTNIGVDGTGHGYELGFIPATEHSNHQSSVGQATTTLDGSVIAGQFDKININIDATGHLSDAGTTSPYTVGFDANFNPVAYLNQITRGSVGNLEGMDNAAVGGFEFGPLYAGGGNLYVYGASVGGNGSLRANGVPSVTINNASTYYLILPGIETSFGSVGKVLVSGGADASHLGNIAVTRAPSDAVPTVTINSSYSNMTSGKTPGIILGDVTNLGGPVNITDLTGSLMQLGSVQANSQVIDVPHGYVVVQPNASGVWYSGGDPTSNLASSWISAFLNGVISSPGYGAGAIANSAYGVGISLNPYINGAPAGYQAKVLVLYGSCAPYTGGSGSESALDGCGGSGPSGGSLSVLGRPVPLAPLVALSQSGKFGASELSSASSFTGQKFIVKARYIDIDGVINAGTQATWTVQTTPALKGWITARNQAYGAGQISNPNIPLTTLDDSGIAVGIKDGSGHVLLQLAGTDPSQLIGAVYNVASRQIILNNITASGGGSVSLNGKIVSTAHGSININSGYGSVTVNNTSGTPLVVRNVYAGSGGQGVITIEDALQKWAAGPNSGHSRITWYVSDNGQPAQQYDNYDGATNWDDSTARRVGAVSPGAVYSPASGAEFQWTASTSVVRSWATSSSHHSWSTGGWNWSDGSGGGTAGQHWMLGNSQFIDPGASNHVNLGSDDYKLSLSGSLGGYHQVNVAYHGCDKHGHCNYGTTESGHDSGGDRASLWAYLYPTTGRLSLTDTQRADLPIGINFITSSSNHVDITSDNDILLTGQITNTHGPTSLTATHGGNIVQVADNALIWTHSLAMQSTAGNIGTDYAPIQVKIAHDTNPGSTLTAATSGGNIAVDVDSGNSTQAFSAIAHANGGSTYGNVIINGTGSLVGIAGNQRDVVGRDVNLNSTQGSIASLTKPLNVETHPDILYNGAFAGGTLNASANRNIGINATGGDVWVGDIESTTGDVSLHVPDGGIYDARQLNAASTLSPKQAKAIWDKLHLTDGSAADSTVTAVNSQVNASYAQYWQLRSVGKVINSRFVLNANALALYWPLAAADHGLDPAGAVDPATTQAYVAARYDAIVDNFNKYIGTGWQSAAAFKNRSAADPSFAFVLDSQSDVYKQLTQDSTWTDGQLKYAINAAALSVPTGGQVGSATPNISARNLTVVAGGGSIGRTGSPLPIDYAELKKLYAGQANTISSAQILALGLANAPGDVVLLDAAGKSLDASDPDLANKLQTLSIAQTMPLYLQATGSVQGSASGSAFLQADGDLHFAGFLSGGDMRVAATGSIDAFNHSDTATAVLNAGGDLLLNAGSGHISLGDGSGNDAGDALPVQIGGGLLNASAATDVMLRQVAGDLHIGTIFANGLVSLGAPTGSVLAILDSLSIHGNDINLQAGGDIGRRVSASTGVDAPLELEVGSGGTLNANAGGATNLDSPQLALNMGTVSSGGNVVLTAANADMDAQHVTSTGGTVTASTGADGQFHDVSAADNVDLTATGHLTATTVASDNGDITLLAAAGMDLHTITASAGAIFANVVGTGSTPRLGIGDGGMLQAQDTIALDSSGSIVMGANSIAQAGGALRLRSAGDITLGKLASMAASGNALDLGAGGAISANGDTLSLQARNGGATVLHAVNDIGSQVIPLVVDVNTLSGTSDNGSVWLHGLGDIGIGDLQASMGSLQLGIDGALTYRTLVAGTDVKLGAHSIDGGTLSAGGAANVQSVGDARLDSATIGEALAVNAGGDMTATTLNVGSNATFDAGRSMTIGTATAGDDLKAVAGRDLTATAVNAGSQATLRSGSSTALTGGASMTLGAVSAGGNLDANAGTDLKAATLTGDNDVTLASGQSMKVDNATAGNDLSATAATDFSATSLDIGRNGTLEAGGNLSLLGVTKTGLNFEMRSDDLMRFTTIDAGGHVFGQSFNGSIKGDAVRAVDWIKFIAAGDIHIGTIDAGTDATLQAGANVVSDTLRAGHDVNVKAGGDVALTHTDAGNAVNFDTGGDLNAGDIKAGHGIALAAGSMHFDTLAAPDSITLLARNGAVTGSTLTTRDATAAAKGAIQLGTAYIGHRFNLAADTIDAHVKQTTSDTPIYSVLTGFESGVASRIAVDVDAPAQWCIDRLAAVNARLATTATSAHIAQGHIEDTMALDTTDARVRMNQHSAGLVPADVQLMQRTYEFMLNEDNVHTFSDAYVVRYSYGFQIQTPNYDASHRSLNPDYLGESAMRYSARTLTRHTDGVDDPTDQRAIPQWVLPDSSRLVQPGGSNDGPAVNLTKASE